MSGGNVVTKLRPSVRRSGGDPERVEIVLLSGSMRTSDRVGHHDYLAGCSLLDLLIRQTSGVDGIVVREGWPEDEGVFDTARSLVVYSGGGRKHPFSKSTERLERMEKMVGRGVGVVMIHQAVRFPPEIAGRVKAWIGGVHVPGESGRGHWRTHHWEFPHHPVTRGVTPWKIRDGWLNEIQFVEGMIGVTPLLWSSRRYRGSSDGGAASVVAWAYERPNGGRSFAFTGLDAHTAWSVPGVRRLLVNAILWSAGLTVPETGAPCAVDDAQLNSLLTPRARAGWRILRTILHRVRPG
jgi:Trehalose utilisation